MNQVFVISKQSALTSIRDNYGPWQYYETFAQLTN